MLGNITVGQYYPGDSVIHRLDPRAKILCTMIFIVGIFFADSWPAYGAVAAFTIAVTVLSQLPPLLVWKAVKPLWVIIVFTLFIHIFTTPGTLVWEWKFLQVTEEGLRQGGMMTARLVFLISFSALLTYTTSPIVLTDGIEQLLNPFKRIGVPAHELAMMMTIALRFIPTLLQETERIMKAQKARGADFESGNLLRRGKALVPLMVPLFVSAFRRADELATAMEARCYRGGEGRTRLHELRYRGRDAAAFAVTSAVVIGLAGARWLL
ncbi:MAG: energy-coupling factor transporter transmembrane protein EcfT [Veillonellaceae bacterium]|nr:energy-coupling factor transporter transmembrane protein EcfT [Veillonellaceae bacterium]